MKLIYSLGFTFLFIVAGPVVAISYWVICLMEAPKQ